MSTPSQIHRHEVAPQTDEEWAEALRLYARDRESNVKRPVFGRNKSSDVLGAFSISPQVHPRPLQHHDDLNELFDSANHTQHPKACYPPSASRQNTHSTDPPSPRNNSGDLLQPGDGRASPSPSQGSNSSMGKSVGTAASGSKPVMTFQIAETMTAPPQAVARGCGPQDADWSADDERWRMREHYEKEGWLPTPIMSEPSRIRKKRAIMRMGFFSPEEEDKKERLSVMAKYAEMARDIFGTSTAMVSLMTCEDQYSLGTDPEEPLMVTPLAEAACGHALIHNETQCTVVADLSKDWRFAKNPSIQALGKKFYAAAPLRHAWKDTYVDIATLCIYDDEPRDTFDARERGILLNLANMLTYQLTTLQGQAAAKRTRSMYEQSFNFLRRSVIPDEHKRTTKTHEHKSKAPKRSPLANDPHPVKPLRAADTRPRRASVTSSRSPEPALTTKSGPRDSRIAKTAGIASEAALFKDSAATLRSILKADHVSVVDLSDYTLFVRKNNELGGGKKDKKGKESIIMDFLQGKPWPEDYAPVIHHTPKIGSQSGVQVLGSDSVSEDFKCNWWRPETERTMQEFLETWVRTRHFWWDREDQGDDLSVRLMDLMPDGAQTTLATAFMTYDGRLRFAMFASWKTPPSAFADANVTSLPFTWILSGCTMAALTIRKMRNLEHSQISYSNLQAHELRTPLHQILAVTQLLRSAMNDLADAPQQLSNGSLTTTEQIRDLLPLLDAIDTSGKTLHGIVDNILSFLDLKGKDTVGVAGQPSLLNSPTGVTQTLEAMFEELIHEAHEEDTRVRQANSQPLSQVETVFEIMSPTLGTEVTEDTGGALRRALAKIIANAYKFIEGDGCVEIYVKAVEDNCPTGCEELALSKKISIEVKDNGRGMDHAFVREKLGEPWAKEDPYATGSGLSVHLAYRIIDLMGGTMEVSSAPGKGCAVKIELHLPLRQPSTPNSPATPQRAELATFSDTMDVSAAEGKRIALVGFDGPSSTASGRDKLQSALQRQLQGLGAQIVDVSQAEMVVADGQMEESAVRGTALVNNTPASEIVFYVCPNHEPHPDVTTAEINRNKSVRRFQKPITPSLIREALAPGQTKLEHQQVLSAAALRLRPTISRSTTSASGDKEVVQPGKTIPESKPKAHFESLGVTASPSLLPADTKGSTSCPIVARLCSFWKPKNLPVEDAVACLSLGDYMNSRRRTTLVRTPSLGESSTYAPSSAGSVGSMPATPRAGSEQDPAEVQSGEGMYDDPMGKEDEEETPPDEPEATKVLVVEDNRINRKILVKLLSSKAPIEVVEAEDGLEAVTLFKEFTSPSIVLLDINMPKMDGFQASLEMRSIESKSQGRGKSQIIAVTALAGDEEKRRGLLECGMDSWLTKPCGKVAIHKAIDEAKQALAEAVEVVGHVKEELETAKNEMEEVVQGLGIKA